ncbi:hypothetical protein GCM10027047_14350 [Rhodococcus aerolatus]
MAPGDDATIYTLGDRGLTVDGSANDVRGRTVRDKDGHGIGRVSELLVDDQTSKVRFLLVEHGGFLGFGATRTLIPAEVVTQTTEHEVRIDRSRDRVAAAPGYDPDLVDDRPHHADIYAHYGLTPDWGAGYPFTPFRPGDPTVADRVARDRS